MGSIINTFDKGLHQDSSYILQPDGTYRNMKNGMLISYDGNHYTVEMTKGNKVLLTLTPRYLDIVADLDAEPMPIGFISFIDKLVVFSTNDEANGGYGEIGVVTFTRSGMDFVGTYVPYYHHASLNFTKFHKIEGFSFRENDNIERVYWTDNSNEPRVFDIANTIFSTYFTPGAGNPLVSGNEYMVLIGAIEHPVASGVFYGPGLTAGNVFTASSTSYTVDDGSPLVIEYYPLSLLDWTPTRTMGNIDFVEYGTGDKNCGNSIYFYRLFLSTDGAKTSWSYGSSPIHVGMPNEATYLTGTPYLDFVGNGSETTIVKSNYSVKVRVQNIDTNFDTIELCCAEFDQKTEIPYQITIVAKEVITGTDMTIEDAGRTNLGTVTISDLTLFPASILKCKTLSTNKNYNIVGNITEREEFDLDLSGVTIGQVNYPIVSHGPVDYGVSGACPYGIVPGDMSPTVGANPGVGDVYPDSRWIVKLGNLTTDTVNYPSGSGFYYVTGDIITGIPYSGGLGDESTITFTNAASVAPCTTRNRYDVISSGDRVEDYIEFTSQDSAFWDFKNPAVSSHNKGYWSGEKYRFGILFYDLKGNPFYVKYIKGDPTTFDYTFDDVATKGGLLLEREYTAALHTYSLNVSGANISGIDIPESIINKCSGFSIVRAERDPTIITQGLMMQTCVDPSDSTRIYPLGFVRTDYSPAATFYTALGDLSSFICPDQLVNYTFNEPVGVIGQNIKEAFWLDDHAKSYSTYNAIASKLFNMPLGYPDAAYPRIRELKSMNGNGSRSFNEYNGDNNIIGTGENYFNRESPVDAATLNAGVDMFCAVGAFPTPRNVQTAGCKKMVIMPDHFNHYGPSIYSYNDNNAANIYEKIVVNMMTGKDPSNQYGGVSSQAIADTLYMSTGHFQPFTAQVKADTDNGFFSGGIYDGEIKYTFNNVEIFGGDCFTNLADVAYGLYDADYAVAPTDSMGYQIWFPCECNANWGLLRGLKGSNKGVYPFSTYPTGVVWNDPGMSPTTQLESFDYNKGYSSDGTFIKYPALPNNYKFTGKFEYRMRWSGLKYPGELINSFRIFRLPDYRDVDAQRGQINNLKARDSKLFYWQDHSVGYTPILERQLVGGSALGDATALGVTGVIDRYDDIDTFFGNQHQHGLTETEFGFAWFDMRRRAFMVMGIGTKPEEMSMVKGLQVFFNSEFNEGNVAYPNSYSAIYNTNNLEIPEVPLQGYGIVGVYDSTFKMTYLTFKYAKRDLVGADESFINRDFTLGYNHILNAFVSFTDNCPAIWHNHNDLVLTANNPKNTKPYNVDMPPTTFDIGDTVLVGSVEYICIASVTIASYPGTTSNGGTSPLALGASGGVNDFWLAINKTNEIYLQNFGADLCKFYGKVWSHDMSIVVNAKTDIAVSAQNIQFKGTGANWTDIVATTDDQTASDVSISSTSRNYRYIDKAWFSSLPLPSNGRLTDYYVKINFSFKNYVTNPTVAKNVQRVLQWLKTTFVNKR